MVKEFEATSGGQARQKMPDAMILRHVGPSRWLAFDRPEDAFRHATAQVDPSVRLAQQ